MYPKKRVAKQRTHCVFRGVVFPVRVCLRVRRYASLVRVDKGGRLVSRYVPCGSECASLQEGRFRFFLCRGLGDLDLLRTKWSGRLLFWPVKSLFWIFVCCVSFTFFMLHVSNEEF